MGNSDQMRSGWRRESNRRRRATHLKEMKTQNEERIWVNPKPNHLKQKTERRWAEGYR